MSVVRKEKGFTLVEVLAALLIFSVSIIGLSHASTQSTRAVTAINLKVLAGIVADNQIVLVRSSPQTLGVQFGESVQMSRAFTYRLETLPTDVDAFYKITVQVSEPQKDHVIVERTAFMSRTP